jgi:protein Tex
MLCCRVILGKDEAGVTFSDYFAHRERFTNTPSHRVLAMLRGVPLADIVLYFVGNP